MMQVAGVGILVYYTMWVYLSPFLDPNHKI